MAQDVLFNAPFRNSINTDHKEQHFHMRYFCEVLITVVPATVAVIRHFIYSWAACPLFAHDGIESHYAYGRNV